MIELDILIQTIIVLVLLVLLYCSVKKSLYSIWNVMAVAVMTFFFVSDVATLFWYFFNHINNHGVNEEYEVLKLINFAGEFINIAWPVFGIVCIFICISNISLIRHEGFRIKNLLGSIIGIGLIAGTGILYLVSYFVKKSGADSSLITFLRDFFTPYFCLILCYFECLMIGMIVMGYIAARQVPKYDKDFIIILGCAISKKGGLLPLLKGRTNRAIRYAWEQEIATGKPLLYVPSGGQGPDEVMSEGSAMALYLESHSAEEYEVFAEKESRNTWENFVLSKKIIDSKMDNPKVAFATTNYHVFRSGLLARKAGFEDIEAISSTTKWYFWPNGFVREMIGIIVQYLRIHIVAVIFLAMYCCILCK